MIMVQTAAHATIEHINRLISNNGQCAQFKLRQIKSAHSQRLLAEFSLKHELARFKGDNVCRSKAVRGAEIEMGSPWDGVLP